MTTMTTMTTTAPTVTTTHVTPRRVALSAEVRAGAMSAAAQLASWSSDDPMTLAQLQDTVRGDSALTAFGQDVLTHLDAVRAVIVDGAPVEDAEAVLALFAAVAIPARLGNGSGTVHRISSSGGEPTDLSETAAEFAAHTDSTFLRSPHDVLALACRRSDGSGGLSFLVDVAAVVAHLDADDATALREPVFPFWLNDPLYGIGRHAAPVLDELGAGTARYRRDVVAQLVPDTPDLEQRHRDALRRLDELLDDAARDAEFALAPGQLLIFDNHRLLHGRTPLGSNTARELLRLKGFRRVRPTYRID